MPRKLNEDVVKVTWRIRPTDLDLLEAVYGEGNVCPLVRDLLTAYCDRLRLKLQGAPHGKAQ